MHIFWTHNILWNVDFCSKHALLISWAMSFSDVSTRPNVLPFYNLGDRMFFGVEGLSETRLQACISFTCVLFFLLGLHVFSWEVLKAPSVGLINLFWFKRPGWVEKSKKVWYNGNSSKTTMVSCQTHPERKSALKISISCKFSGLTKLVLCLHASSNIFDIKVVS